MSTISSVETMQCADEESHPSHAWGWKKKCPGVVSGMPMTYSKIQALAALHHEALMQALTEHGLARPVKWSELSVRSQQARIYAMRQVMLDQMEARKP